MSLPPPGEAPPPQPWSVELELEAGGGGLRRLVARRPGRLTVSASRLVVEHPTSLRAPLELAPGGIAVAALDPGPPKPERDTGRFPILRRLSPTAVVPREEGIEGWLWTSSGGSAYTVLDGDVAPNLALVFLKPLEADVVAEVFDPGLQVELAKRSPLGSPTVFGTLLRVARSEQARVALDRIGLLRPLTDREVPPSQRRHLPTDRPANPAYRGDVRPDSQTSVPPPGAGR